ncbi:hypothetical protein AG0111_0g1428 [Alternaria gaisen]|uniref:Uncharacterized protein n=1 Tax=Alternaria gaisen TaxID=167740 RepID=A0ACB6G1Z2_9PLEO|nr:hypothetical protein AG0111_0g1428 [Alternaria gaisen]
MNSPSNNLSPQSLSITGGRSKRATLSEEPGKKPKKPNSEIRKQQNRIASRNYREKRKRKLQYLQQLVNDDSDSHQDPEPSPEQREIYPRSLSADYQVAGPSSSPYRVPFDRALGANSAVVTQAILAATVASFDNNHLPAEQAYPPYQPTWNAPIYSPPPPANIPWNMPPAWMESLTYPPQTTITRPPMYRYNTHPAHSTFQQAHTPSPSHIPRESLPSPDLYDYGADYTYHSQTSSNLNVSLPTSHSPYYQGYHHPAPH